MSIPTKAFFYKDNEIVKKLHTNCGWIPDKKIRHAIRTIVDTSNILYEQGILDQEDYFVPDDFDYVEICFTTLTKKGIQ